MKTNFLKTALSIMLLTMLISPIATVKAEDWNEYEENQRFQEQVSELEKEVSELRQEVSELSENSEKAKTTDKKRNWLLFLCFLLVVGLNFYTVTDKD